MDGTLVDLNFLFQVTLGRPQAMAKMQSVRVPQKLPVILSKEEMTRLIACVRHIKHQTALSLAYGTGLPKQRDICRRLSVVELSMPWRTESTQALRVPL